MKVDGQEKAAGQQLMRPAGALQLSVPTASVQLQASQQSMVEAQHCGSDKVVGQEGQEHELQGREGQDLRVVDGQQHVEIQNLRSEGQHIQAQDYSSPHVLLVTQEQAINMQNNYHRQENTEQNVLNLQRPETSIIIQRPENVLNLHRSENALSMHRSENAMGLLKPESSIMYSVAAVSSQRLNALQQMLVQQEDEGSVEHRLVQLRDTQEC